MNNKQEKRIGNIFFFLLLFGFLYLFFLMFKPFLDILMLSLIITIVAYPIYERLKSETNREGISALFATFFVLLFILIPCAIFLIVLVQQIIEVVPIVTDFFAKNSDYQLYLKKYPLIYKNYQKVINLLEKNNIELNFSGLFSQHYTTVASFLLDNSKMLLKNIGLIFVDMLFVLLTIFFFFRDGKRYHQYFLKIIPLSEVEKKILSEKSSEAIKAIFIGTILTGLAQAILGFIGYLIAGLPFSLFWGFATFLASLLPLGGAAFIWVPLAIYSFFANGFLTSFLLFLWGIFGISMADNILRPLLIGGKTNINTIVLVFAILGGLQIFGFMGIFVAPVVIVIINNLLLIYQERFFSAKISEISDLTETKTN